METSEGNFYVGIVADRLHFTCLQGKDARDYRHYVTNVDAVGLGAKSLYDAYFVCITVSGERTLIEYGKSKGTRDTGNVFLSMVDRTRNFDVRFYAFGNEGAAARIVDAHIVSRKLFQMTCRENTVKDAKENLCMEGCHRACDPFESRLFSEGVSIVLLLNLLASIRGAPAVQRKLFTRSRELASRFIASVRCRLLRLVVKLLPRNNANIPKKINC